MKNIFLLILSTFLLLSCSANKRGANNCITLEEEVDIPILIGSNKIMGYPLKVRFIKSTMSTRYPIMSYMELHKGEYIGWSMYNGKTTSKIRDIKCNAVNDICILLIMGESYTAVIQAPTAEILCFETDEVSFNNGQNTIIELRRNQ